MSRFLWRPALTILILLTANCVAARVFPNPTVNFEQCGNEEESHVCDPKEFLTTDQREELSQSLQNIADETENLQQGDACRQKGISVFVAVADQIRNDRRAHEEEMQEFVQNVRQDWQIDPQCNKEVIIALWTTDRQIFGMAGPKVGLSNKKLSAILNSHTKDMKEGRYKEGLEGVAQAIQKRYEEKSLEMQSRGNAKLWAFHVSIYMVISVLQICFVMLQ